MKRLQGKVAIVTGSSSGIGKAIALTFAQEGARVVVSARRQALCREVVAQIKERGGEAMAMPTDVADEAQVERLITDTVAAYGRLDILVNNAGIAIVKAPERYQDEDWDAVYETNLRGPWTLAQAVIQHRLRDGRPVSIINVASVLGMRPRGHIPPYAAAKAALINLGRDLCVDLAAKGIRVNALAPGYFETEMNREWLKSPAGERLRADIPSGRFGQPEDLDGAILFLASDASRFMNGAVLTIDGGHTAGL